MLRTSASRAGVPHRDALRDLPCADLDPAARHGDAAAAVAEHEHVDGVLRARRELLHDDVALRQVRHRRAAHDADAGRPGARLRDQRPLPRGSRGEHVGNGALADGREAVLGQPGVRLRLVAADRDRLRRRDRDGRADGVEPVAGGGEQRQLAVVRGHDEAHPLPLADLEQRVDESRVGLRRDDDAAVGEVERGGVAGHVAGQNRPGQPEVRERAPEDPHQRPASAGARNEDRKRRHRWGS